MPEKLVDRKKQTKQMKQRSFERYRAALIERQKQVRREVPFADERTLNLMFTE